MEKEFLEVFSKIENKSLNPILESAKILRISTNPTKDKMRIYIQFSSIVPKKTIWKLEEAIQKEYFNAPGMEVTIIESFLLSDVYTPESLFNTYKDSIFEEINKISSINHSIVKKADYDFEDNKICIRIEDTAVAHARAEEIEHIFSVIFHDRCHQDVLIDLDYKKARETKYKKEQEAKIDRMIDFYYLILLLRNRDLSELREDRALPVS